MLKKFIAIKNVGRFQNCDAEGDVQHKRVTLVFAENGRGKSTLCDILRSLNLGEPAHVVGRKTLGAAADPSVKILTQGDGVITFVGGTWDKAFPNIAIFDSTFVSENVHAGDTVDIGHRRSLYRVIVGKDGVDLARQIETLDAASREKASEVKDKSAALQAHFPRSYTLASFLGLKQDAAIDQKIIDAERELDAVKQANEIKARPQLSAAALPTLPAGLEELLTKTLQGVVDDAGQRVAAHISAHDMGSRGERWLSEGLQYAQGSGCPFCEQPLTSAAVLIDAYKAYFSQEYEQLRAAIAPMRDRVEGALGEKAIAQFEKTMDLNAQGVAFWSQFVNITSPESMAAASDQIRALRQATLARLERKTAAPLDAIGPDDAFTVAAEAYAGSQTAMTSYNAAVATGNVVIAAKKTATGAADQKAVEANLERLRLTKKRHEPAIALEVAAYEKAVAEKGQLDLDKQGVKDKLDEHTKNVITKYEQTINRLLTDFGTGFRLTGTDHGYPGGQASSSYRILINEVPVELGDAATPISAPSFRNTLSAGDKSTLALAFFLAQLEQDPGRATKVVVFDDPFSSQDAFRKDHTVAKIKKTAEASSQVIVFSHDRGFLKRIWERIDTADRKALRLSRVGVKNSTISDWDIDKDTQDLFAADRQALVDYYNANQGKPRDIVNKIRPVLETYCRLLYPSLFGEKEMLGGIIAIIREQGASHPLRSIDDDLEQLNEYTKRYHHGESPNAATEPIDDEELHNFVRQTLNVMGWC